jgi:hypothetical protein
MTRIGKELAPAITQLPQEIEAVVVNTKEPAAQSRDVIRIASPPSISSTILPTAIAGFKGLYPGISVVLKDVISQRLVAMVKVEEVDFGIGSLNLADPEVRFSLLLTDRPDQNSARVTFQSIEDKTIHMVRFSRRDSDVENPMTCRAEDRSHLVQYSLLEYVCARSAIQS